MCAADYIHCICLCTTWCPHSTICTSTICSSVLIVPSVPVSYQYHLYQCPNSAIFTSVLPVPSVPVSYQYHLYQCSTSNICTCVLLVPSVPVFYQYHLYQYSTSNICTRALLVPSVPVFFQYHLHQHSQTVHYLWVTCNAKSHLCFCINNTELLARKQGGSQGGKFGTQLLQVHTYMSSRAK